MKKIPLTKGKVALVDDIDYGWLVHWKWYFDGRYAARTELSENGKRNIFMHRVIANTPQNLITDHINGNQLDNRKCNLRTCTDSQNVANSKLHINNTSGVKGVVRNNKQKWLARINFHNKEIYIGVFNNIEDAAKAYDQKAIELFGEFARTNEELQS